LVLIRAQSKEVVPLLDLEHRRSMIRTEAAVVQLTLEVEVLAAGAIERSIGSGVDVALP
jgi:hypothetical protein